MLAASIFKSDLLTSMAEATKELWDLSTVIDDFDFTVEAGKDSGPKLCSPEA